MKGHLDTNSPFHEANKRLSSEECEDLLNTSSFLVTMNQLQASLMQSVSTSVSTAIKGNQSQIVIQACSGLNRPLLRTRPNSCSTLNHASNDVIKN